MPECDPPLAQEHQKEQQGAHQAENNDRGNGQAGIECAVGHQYEMSKPSIGGNELRDHCADDGIGDGDPDTSQDLRQGGRNFEVDEGADTPDPHRISEFTRGSHRRNAGR